MKTVLEFNGERHELKPIRGGKRAGAGRKANPDERKIPLAIKLAVELSEYLATVESKTGAIEEALRRSKGFREWRKNVGG